MKKLYQNFLSVRLTKTLLLSLLLLGASCAAQAQLIFRASQMTGAKEATPNISPATGNATVTIDITNHTMRVQATFLGLVSPTAAAHIHAPTLVPGVGTAGVATALPSFPGFPLGVQAGTYDMTFNMLDPSSYNINYINNNGGTPASAFTALIVALSSGSAYFNIHTSVFPGGEIRDFFVLCPALSVSIPDAYALSGGVLPNTVYPAYAPASSITLEASASGGAEPYSFSWSDDSETSDITVSPVVTTEYTVTVLDQNGCPGTASKTIEVVDVAGGKKGDKIVVCHKGGTSMTLDAAAVAAHLAHGDMLGSCSLLPGGASLRIGLPEQDAEELSAIAYPNPSLTHFDLKISGKVQNNVEVKVYDLLGRVVESLDSVRPEQALRLGMGYTPGLYIVEIVQGSKKQTLRMLKGK